MENDPNHASDDETPNHEAGSIDAEQVREAVNRWGTEGLFRPRRWGDAIRVVSTRPLPSYILTLETEAERRRIERRRIPDDGSPVSSGVTPGPWDVEVPAPTAFDEKRVERIPVPHSARVIPCDGCGSRGRVECPACGGSGRAGRTGGGSIPCSRCGSAGTIDHPPCAGRGRLREYDEVVAEYSHHTVEDRLSAAPVPESWIAAAGRVPLVDQWRKGGGFAPPESLPEMAPILENLWRRSLPPEAESMRILFQRIRVERVRGTEVTYETPRHLGSRKLWIVGDAERVIAPDAPKAWGRIAAVAVPAGAAAGILLFLLAAFLLSMVRSGGAPGRANAEAGAGRDRDGRAVILVTPPTAKRGGAGNAGGAAAGPGESSNGETTKEDRPVDKGTTAQSNEMAALDEETDLEEAPEETEPWFNYDVIAGVYHDPDEARDVAERIEEAVYEPSVSSTTGDADGRLYVVSIRGFLSKESAEDAARELRSLGITAAEARAAPLPSRST